jgi:hypothetical protein
MQSSNNLVVWIAAGLVASAGDVAKYHDLWKKYGGLPEILTPQERLEAGERGGGSRERTPSSIRWDFFFLATGSISVKNVVLVGHLARTPQYMIWRLK